MIDYMTPGVAVIAQIAKLQQQVKTLERENVMLRQVIRNMQGGGDKSDAN